jgi:gluconate 2-dehydrogenase gamma chain
VHTEPKTTVRIPSQPTFFQPAEFKTIEAMSECIIPRTDTPGAKDAGVALLIDKAIVADPTLSQPYRAGIADVNALSLNMFGAEFAALHERQQLGVLMPLSIETESPMGKFFSMVKDMTIDAYYATEIGLKTELGWHGNTFLPSFQGCDHPEHQA